MSEFPEKAYGISPVGHNFAPSGNTGNGNSTNEISEGEEQPLFWSTFRQTYVDWMTLKQDEDHFIDEWIHRKTQEDEDFRQRAGFSKTIS